MLTSSISVSKEYQPFEIATHQLKEIINNDLPFYMAEINELFKKMSAKEELEQKFIEAGGPSTKRCRDNCCVQHIGKCTPCVYGMACLCNCMAEGIFACFTGICGGEKLIGWLCGTLCTCGGALVCAGCGDCLDEQKDVVCIPCLDDKFKNPLRETDYLKETINQVSININSRKISLRKYYHININTKQEAMDLLGKIDDFKNQEFVNLFCSRFISNNTKVPLSIRLPKIFSIPNILNNEVSYRETVYYFAFKELNVYIIDNLSLIVMQYLDNTFKLKNYQIEFNEKKEQEIKEQVDAIEDQSVEFVV